MTKKIHLQINNRLVEADEGMTILEAAKVNGIHIPTLCYLKGLNDIGACRVCVVELEGKERLIPSCNNVVEEGMVIYTNSPKVRMNRKKTVEFLLSKHDCQCAVCARSGNCTLQKIANDLNIIDVPFKQRLERKPWNKEFPLIRDSAKCIKCMRCVQVCDKVQSLNVWDLESTGSRTTVQVSKGRNIEEANCSLCGQCITHCPVGALRERDDTDKVWAAIDNKKKVTVVQVAPAVRAAWGEALGLSREEATIGKIVDALRQMGFDYVFDTTFSADLTIMEESEELLEALEEKDRKYPLFTSCCPGWIRFVETQYPHLMQYVSTSKSPMEMFGAVIKEYYRKQDKKEGKETVSVAIMPCTAKKFEASREEFKRKGIPDVDYVLTSEEVITMLQEIGIRFDRLEPEAYDMPFSIFSGAGVIFGATGGVTEAAVRRVVEDKSPKALKEIEFIGARGMEGVKICELPFGERQIRIAVVSGLGNADHLLQKIESGEEHFDFVEVMACPGGCVAGAGQPFARSTEKRMRAEGLYKNDKAMQIKRSEENPLVESLYKDLLKNREHDLLHVDYLHK